MTNFTDEIKAIPEDLASFTKGDIKLGNTKIPKVVIALIVVAVVAFLALKSRSTSQKSTSSARTDKTSENSNDTSLSPLPVNDTPLSGIGGISSSDNSGYGEINNGLIPLGNDGGFLFGGGSAFNDLGVPNLSGNSQVITPDNGLSSIPYFGSSSYDGGYLSDILPQQPQAPLQNIVASSSGLINANKQGSNPLQKALSSRLNPVKTSNPLQSALSSRLNPVKTSNPLQSALGKSFTKQPTPLSIPQPVVQQFKPVSTVVNTFSNLAKNLVNVITPKQTIAPVITVPKIATPKVNSVPYSSKPNTSVSTYSPKPSASSIPYSNLSKVKTVPKPVTGIKSKTVVLKN